MNEELSVFSQNILYLTYDGLTDPLGQSQILPYLTQLVSRERKIYIISCDKPNLYYKRKDDIDNQISKFEHLSWYSIPYKNFPKGLGPLINIYRLYNLCDSILKKYNISILHCRSQIPAMIGLKLKRRYPVNLIYDMRGFWADERVEGGIWNIKNPVYYFAYQYFKKQEKKLIQKADEVIVLTDKAKEIIHRTIKKKVSINIIPCCADFDYFNPNLVQIDNNKFVLERLQIQSDQSIICYLGSFGTWYLLREMLVFFKKYNERYPKSTLLFLTNSNPNSIYQISSEINLDDKNIRHYSAERGEIAEILSYIHWGIFFIKPTYSKQASSPTKFAEFLSMDKPIITNSGIGDIDEHMKELNSGVICQDFTNSSLENLIEQMSMYNQPSKNSLRKKAAKIYNLSRGVQLYNKIYNYFNVEPG